MQISVSGHHYSVSDRTKTYVEEEVAALEKFFSPLVDVHAIGKRLDGVEELAFDVIGRSKIREILKDVLDLERLLARITLGSAGPRDFAGLAVRGGRTSRGRPSRSSRR